MSLENGPQVLPPSLSSGVALLPTFAPIDADQLVAMFLSGRSPSTIAAYRADLKQFAAFVGATYIADAARLLLGGTPGAANAFALRFRTALVERGYAAATINRRLAALRALTTLARILGLVTWELEIANISSRSYRDTKGPGDVGVRLLLAAAGAQADRRKATRDVALLRLLHDVALRRGEVCALDVADLDLAAGRLMVCGKGRTEKEGVTLPVPTRAALAAWLELRGIQRGPLVLNFDITGKGPADARLTGAGVWSIVHKLGVRAGFPAWPHGLRHSAITRALDATGGNLRTVQRFSRHRDVRSLMIYDDNRQDLAAGVAELVAMKEE